MPAKQYYQKIAKYFDEDAKDFEDRYAQNPTLQKIRTEFRNNVDDALKNRFISLPAKRSSKKSSSSPIDSSFNVLEIGCGPGLDLEYFAKKYPHANIVGIDVSLEMVQLAKKNTQQYPNVQVLQSSIENVAEKIKNVKSSAKNGTSEQKFDIIYCFFGALNTIYDFSEVPSTLSKLLAPEGKLVLTFINRWYLADVFINLAALRPKKAFSRFTNNWGGYSPKRKLESIPRSARQINGFFSKQFFITKSVSYSLFYPAWYRSHWPLAKGSIGNVLWNVDKILNYTPAKYFGEYSLYVLERKTS